MASQSLAGKSTIVVTAVLATLALGAGAPSRGAAGGKWWILPQRLTWYWQLQGRVRSTKPVAAYDIDGFENGASEVAALHGQGVHVICYIDVGTAENFRPDYSEFPKSVLGRSNGWPGERWLDIRQLSVLEPIMQARFQMCREKGFDAVEPDNIEGYANKTRFPLTAEEQLTYNEWVADRQVTSTAVPKVEIVLRKTSSPSPSRSRRGSAISSATLAVAAARVRRPRSQPAPCAGSRARNRRATPRLRQVCAMSSRGREGATAWQVGATFGSDLWHT